MRSGKESKDLPINTQEVTYNAHIEKTQKPQEFPKPPQTASLTKQHQLEVSKFKEKIAMRGPKGLIGLKKQFKIIDSDNSGLISLPEFQEVIDNYKIPGMSASDA
jgi:hypothetical protein